MDFFINDLHNINWKDIYDSKNNINDCYDLMINEINAQFDKHAPLSKIGKNKAKLFSVPWITKGIRKSIKVRDKLHRRFSIIKANAAKKQEI